MKCTQSEVINMNSQIKQFNEISTIIRIMEKDASEFTLDANETICQPVETDRQFVWLFKEGICALVHRESQLEITKLKPPYMYGVIDGFNYIGNHLLIAETECHGIMIPFDIFINNIDINNKWANIAKIISIYLQTILSREEKIFNLDSYAAIRTNLIELNNFQNETGLRVNVFYFIKKRTKLSKSTIYRILSELKKGSFITLENGYLININRLPLKY